MLSANQIDAATKVRAAAKGSSFKNSLLQSKELHHLQGAGQALPRCCHLSDQTADGNREGERQAGDKATTFTLCDFLFIFFIKILVD